MSVWHQASPTSELMLYYKDWRPENKIFVRYILLICYLSFLETKGVSCGYLKIVSLDDGGSSQNQVSSLLNSCVQPILVMATTPVNKR
jgi:hypothetical protein